jgi:hypothetical protein
MDDKNLLTVNPEQTFLEDETDNLWPILTDQMAYGRMIRYPQTKQIFKEGAYGEFLGTTAEAVIGALIGIVAGENVASEIGKGAAVGAVPAPYLLSVPPFMLFRNPSR